jgi:hypothetical protein
VVGEDTQITAEKQAHLAALTKANEALDNAALPIQKILYNTLHKTPQRYTGQHSSIASDNPIGFARYVDLPIELPQAGYPAGKTVPSMAFLELQPDRLDDVRKYGARGKTSDLDSVRRDELLDQQNSMLRSVSDSSADPVATERILNALVKDIDNAKGRSTSDILEKAGIKTPEQKKPFVDFIKTAQERKRLENRISLETQGKPEAYNIESPFAGMENKPQEVQQLFIKNAINGAMDRNINVITFPGKDSAQAQLYTRVEQNAKAVAKELNKLTGGGFNVGMLKRMTDAGDVREYPGIWWDAAASKKLREAGIPFAKGGMVERNTDDNRRYL